MRSCLRFTLIFALLFFCSGSSFGQDVKSLKWLSGNWIMKTEKSTTTESWSIRNDSTIVGSSLTVSNDGETLFEEALKISTRDNETTYIALLPDKTARFKTALLSKTSAIFIDKSNDFPSKITYLKTKTGIQVVLEGKGNKEVLNFVRNTH